MSSNRKAHSKLSFEHVGLDGESFRPEKPIKDETLVNRLYLENAEVRI